MHTVAQHGTRTLAALEHFPLAQYHLVIFTVNVQHHQHSISRFPATKPTKICVHSLSTLAGINPVQSLPQLILEFT